MTKAEYAAAIAANQTAVAVIRTDLRKLRSIEKLAKSFSDLNLVDTAILNNAIAEKKIELTKLRTDLSKARRIVKRMTEIENIETGKADAPKAKKSSKTGADSTAKKSTGKKVGARSAVPKKQADKTGQAAVEDSKETSVA